jgi:hypothetical protein
VVRIGATANTRLATLHPVMSAPRSLSSPAMTPIVTLRTERLLLVRGVRGIALRSLT